jgi:lipoprotein-anchoring transpeptidase ErfK/SrfK
LSILKSNFLLMWRKIVKFEIIVLIVGALLVFTMPILAREIDEMKFSLDDYKVIRTGLPDNETIAWSGELPEIEDKIKIKKIVIDLSEQMLYTYENEEITGKYLVSTGKAGMWTPLGEFKIHNKNPRAWSSYGLWMPYWMVIDPARGIGIHELPEWPNGYKEGEDHLGTPVSHGCIRLGVGPAETVYSWADIDTKVEIIE